jgi:hypothetical protein
VIALAVGHLDEPTEADVDEVLHAAPVRGRRPWNDVFEPIPPERIRRAARESLAWSGRHAAGDEFARVNALRARHYLERGEWLSKAEAS